MAPALFKRKSSETRSTDVEASGALSISLHLLPTISEEKFSKLPDSPQVTLSQELTTNLISSCPSILSTDNKTVGRLFSSASDCPKSLCHSFQANKIYQYLLYQGISSGKATTFGIGAIQVIVTGISTALVDKAGRRILLIVSSLMTASSLLVATMFYLQISTF